MGLVGTGHVAVTPELIETLGARLARAASGAAEAGWDALIVTPGANLVYLIGYDAVPLERITALVIPAQADPFLIVPRLERLAALASPAGALQIPVVTWDEHDDPYQLIADRLGEPTHLAVDNDMTASKVLRLRDALPQVRLELAGPVLDGLRQVKDPWEIDALREAADAIDRVHARVGGLLRPGRTEAEVGADIAELILAEGHIRVDFIIVASGPNAASPHHAVSDRVIAVGEPIVVDIGGTMPSGYRSDCTRTYCIGEPAEEFLRDYQLLQEAQERAVQGVRPGATSGEIDGLARDHLGSTAEYFIHRTGHGIGLLTHEEPYIMAGSDLPLQAGMAFSVEPGFYIESKWGARIEDIVVCTPDGVESLNRQSRDLHIVPSSAS